jgi:segregation and condensation protein A
MIPARMSEYRVNLDVYNGPLDLLLYLIRRDEVDICDIPISRVTEQYVAYVNLIQSIDPNLAGEFLVMAATLMEIKTRMLLPAPPPEEGGAESTTIDPRSELVRQLLEYKAFKDAAGDLRAAADMQAMKFPRRPIMPDSTEAEIDIEDVQVWDLLDAFSRMMTAIGQSSRQHHVVYDDTPIELHADDIMDRLRREGELTFQRIFEGRTNRSEIVGLFLALLELVKQKKIIARQDRNFGEIAIAVNTAPVPTIVTEESPAEAPQVPPPGAPLGTAVADDPAGTYISETPPGEEPHNHEDDDDSPEIDGIGA